MNDAGYHFDAEEAKKDVDSILSHLESEVREAQKVVMYNKIIAHLNPGGGLLWDESKITVRELEQLLFQKDEE